MIGGFVISEGCGRKVSSWSEGPPIRSFRTEPKTPNPIETRSFRYDRCGYLESYAAAQDRGSACR